MEDRKNTVGEEASAIGQRVKGATKDAVGAVTGNESLEREGELENQRGRERQAANVVGAPGSSSRDGHGLRDRPLSHTGAGGAGLRQSEIQVSVTTPTTSMS